MISCFDDETDDRSTIVDLFAPGKCDRSGLKTIRAFLVARPAMTRLGEAVPVSLDGGGLEDDLLRKLKNHLGEDWSKFRK